MPPPRLSTAAVNRPRATPLPPQGRAALKDWFGSEPAAPLLEVEGFLRLFLGDQATKEELRSALEATARHARELHAKGATLIEELLDTGGPFPQRLHLIERQSTFLDGFYRNLIEWCEQSIIEIEQWPDTRNVGLTPRGGRTQWERILAEPEP